MRRTPSYFHSHTAAQSACSFSVSSETPHSQKAFRRTRALSSAPGRSCTAGPGWCCPCRRSHSRCGRIETACGRSQVSGQSRAWRCRAAKPFMSFPKSLRNQADHGHFSPCGALWCSSEVEWRTSSIGFRYQREEGRSIFDRCSYASHDPLPSQFQTRQLLSIFSDPFIKTQDLKFLIVSLENHECAVISDINCKTRRKFFLFQKFSADVTNK